MRQKRTVLDTLTRFVTPKPRKLTGQDLVQNTTVSVPQGLLGQLRIQPYNPQLLDLFRPNRLAREQGWGVIENMLEDSQVRANSAIKRGAPCSKGWSLTNKTEGDRQAQEITQFVQDNFTELERPLELITFDFLESTWTGLSISEQLWRREKRGMYKNKLMLSDIETRPPSMVDVRCDASGNVLGVITADDYGTWQDQQLISRFKFVIHTWQGRYGSPYGQGDAQAVYKHWWAKEFLLRAHSVYMDKYGAPSIIGRQSTQMSADDVDLFEELLRSVQHEGYALLPPDWSIDWLFPPGGGTNAQAFLDAMDWHDSRIALAMLGSSLSTNQNVGDTGSFSQAQVHENTRDLILARVKREAEQIMIRQVIKRLILLNYGRDASIKYCPKFEFSPQDLDDVTALVGLIVQLVTAGVIDPSEPWIRERLYLPPHADVADHVAKIAKSKAALQKDVNRIAGLQPPGGIQGVQQKRNFQNAGAARRGDATQQKSA